MTSASPHADRTGLPPVTLDRLVAGRVARVRGFADLQPDVADRLIEMGFDEGAEVERLHTAPLGDPIAIRVDGAVVAIRVAVAARILLDEAV